MDFSGINWLAVLACVVVSMIVGGLWFSPRTFFPIWWKAIGKGDQQPSEGSGGGAGMAMVWVLTILSSLVQAVIMAATVNGLGSTTLAAGAVTGFLVWLGFVAATSLTNKLFADQLKAWVLEAGNHLVTLVLFGAILGAWR
jgi:hypothetical protein